MASLSEKILQVLEKEGNTDTLRLAQELGEDHQRIIGGVKSLLASEAEIITAEQLTRTAWELTAEGEEIKANGSHEALVFHKIPPEGASQKKLQAVSKIGFSKAMSKGWIKYDKSSGIARRAVNEIDDEIQRHFQNLDSIPDSCRKEYKKRKLMKETAAAYYTIAKGRDFTTTMTKLETDLTAEMIADGSWKTAAFKCYNFDALGQAPACGSLHPLLKMRSEFRQIFLEMGFSEMPTNNYVENSFWNFDALFQPQKHPARDAHDTFFLEHPKESMDADPDYVYRVMRIHSLGGYGSDGYGYDWSLDEAKKNLLRTHTTAVTTRMLYSLAQKPVFEPSKYFSIDRVFRNETLDATHLAEFHQVEGVVVDHNLTLGNLIGILRQFFKKLGMEKLKFKPAYNPYTEPSMEIFSFHEGLGKWIEIGNSGMFRPEMLLPMGFPPSVMAIAWGLSLERPAMIKHRVNNIRDLFGPKINLSMVYDSPICMFN